MKKNLNAIIIFGLFTFYYLVMELFINDYAAFIFDAKQVTTLYGISYLMVGIGFPLYYLINRPIKNSNIKLLLLGCIACVSFISAIIVSFTNNPQLLATCALLAHLTAGYFGGAIYGGVAMALKDSGRVGLTIAIGYAGANIIQIIGIAVLANFSVEVSDWVERSSLLVAMLIVLMLIPNSKVEPATNRARRMPEKSFKKLIWVALIAMALMALMHGLTDGIITVLHASEGEFIAYGYPRIFVIPGLIFAGLVADIKNKSVFSFGVVAAMLITLGAILLFYTPDTSNIATCFVYFFGSFMSVYSVAVFVELAPLSSRPDLVASAGRGVRYFFAGLAIIITSQFYETVPLTVLVIAYIVLEILLFAVFFFMGQLQVSKAQMPEAKLADYAQYNLTERETEVLTMLVQGKSTSDIATELYVSEHTVRTHISNLLAKTNTKNRVELIRNFM